MEVNIMNNYELRLKAREALSGKWGAAVIVVFIYGLIGSALNALFTGIFIIPMFLVTVPLTYGLRYAYLKLIRGDAPKVEDLFTGFRDYIRVVVTGVLMSVFIFLWSLLLIVPGIIAAISYSMTYFILMDDKDITYNDAIKLSKEMMNGHKMQFFLLMLSFIGWWLLSVLTFGIGFLWLGPYIDTSIAALYEELKVGNSGAEIIDVQEPEELLE